MENLKIKTELLNALSSKNLKEVVRLFEEYPAIDLADIVNEINLDDKEEVKKILYIFRVIKPSVSAEFFSELDSDVQTEIITLLSGEQLGDLVDELSTGELADFIEEWPANAVDKVLKNTDPAQRTIINKLLGYKDDSAGSIMTTEYLTLFSEDSVSKALETIRKVGKNVETIYTMFVRNKKFDLIGVIELDDLIFANQDAILADVCDKNFQSVSVNDDQEDVANLFKRYDLNAIAVLNEDKKLTGVITIDAIMDVVEEETNEDIQAMAKVAPLTNSYMDTPIIRLAFKCIPWLIVLMVLNIGSIAIQNQFQWLIGTLTVISVFLTTICDAGGNSGQQSSTLIIRGLSTNDFELKDYGKVIWKEMRVALIVGSIVSVTSFLYCMFMFGVGIVSIPADAVVPDTTNSWLILSGIVGITLLITIIVSKFIGASLPFLITRIHLDPAVVTGPLITTVMDVTTLSLYFLMLLASFKIMGWL